MYIGPMIHSNTQKLGVVDKLCHLTISITSERLLNISTNLGNGTSLKKTMLYVHLDFDLAYLQWEQLKTFMLTLPLLLQCHPFMELLHRFTRKYHKNMLVNKEISQLNFQIIKC